MGATFDPPLLQEMSTAISDEARAYWNQGGGQHLGLNADSLTLWSPVVNLARDPRWGRTQECYGEDPCLTAHMGVAFVHGLQGDDPHYIKVISTPKHFAANNEESGRFGKNITCDERYLQEFEFAGFRACIEDGHAESIMAAYTSINGVPSSANKWLLTDVLRGEWGFHGYVVSDCGAVSHVADAFNYAPTPEGAIADCLNAGLDFEGGDFAKYPDVVNNYLQGAIDQKLVTTDVVNHAVSLVLTGRFKLGMYDPADRVPYSKIPMSVVGSPEHIALARKLADESMVLLKNAPASGAPLLPIDPSKVKKIVLVGTYANTAQVGDYSGKPSIVPVTPLQGLQARALKSGITISEMPWQNKRPEVVPSSMLTPAKADAAATAGLTGEYFTSFDLTGTPQATRTDPDLNFDWSHTQPDPLAMGKQFSVRWTGQLKTITPGFCTFSLEADGGYRVYIDGKLAIDRWPDNHVRRELATEKIDVPVAGEHPVRIEYHHKDGGDTGVIFRWTPARTNQDYASLADADLVIAVIGISPQYESEGKDRLTLDLPPDQEDLIHQVVANNPRTVVVLESGSPLAVPWVADNVPALLQAWYPGEEGGDALADVLFGDYNPSGRLPLTFYASDAQLRPITEYDLTKGRTYMYFRDKPLYVFGHGLSYTQFQYGPVQLSKPTATTDDQVTATVDVTNTGSRDGDEVVQCYVHAQTASVPMPIRQLWAFQRVAIPKGQTKTVTLPLETKNFGHWSQAAAEIRGRTRQI